MRRYAVAITHGPLLNAQTPAEVWIEFYDADDAAHAVEQAEDANGPGTVQATRECRPPLCAVLAALRAERDHYARRSERIQALADGDRIDPLGTRLYEAEYAVGAQWGLALAISAIQKEVLDA